jgi:hypothetical protein
VQQVLLDLKAVLGLQAPKVLQVLQVPQALKGLQVLQALTLLLLDLLAHKGQLEPQVLPGLKVMTLNTQISHQHN